MSWLAENAIALAAFLLSVVAVWRTRHRVPVVARSVTASGGPGGDRNFTFVMLTVGSIGRAISVENVSFQAVDGPKTGQGATWGNPPDIATTLYPFEPIPSHMTRGLLIPDGDSHTWSLSLNPPPSMRGKPWDRVQYVAEVKLSNGKTKQSRFWHAQSPLEGWDPIAE